MKFIDMTGWVMSEHGVPDSRLTVIKIYGRNEKNRILWECKCSCGSDKVVIAEGGDIRKQKYGTKSCGCLAKEQASQRLKKHNAYDLESEEYGIGYTSKGEEFWFDKEDYDLIKDYCWFYNNWGHLVSRNTDNNKYIFLHRLVLGITEYDNSICVDHKKHLPRREHKFDNRKSNLEIVNSSENSMNRAKRTDNTSGTTGVNYQSNTGKWCARIQKDGKRITIGYFNNKDDAINARKEAEIKYFEQHRYDNYNS